MDLTFDQPGDHYFIRSIGDQGIRIGDNFHQQSLIVCADRLITDWPPQSFESINDGHIDQLIALEEDLVLLGTGSRQHFLSQREVFRFYEKGIGIEVMNTEAACRTFNVLVTEGRKVAAALLPMA